LLQELDAMPKHLSERFASLPVGEAAVSGPGGGFSPVEQCWHLADLEREGFGVRLRRLYLALIRSIASADWSRSGTQEGVGKIMLCDMPHMMAQHDASHRAEIEAWFANQRGA